MSWTIECNEEEKYITVVNSGRCTAQDVIDQLEALIGLVKEKAIYDVLVDDTAMAMTLTLSDIQHLPKMYKVMGVPKQGRVALVFSESTHRAEDFKFYEKVAMAAGYTIKLFKDREAAMGWLKSS
jgi:hypothetical protein